MVPRRTNTTIDRSCTIAMNATDFKPKSDFLEIMISRGYVHQCSDFEGLDQKAKAGELTTYVGYDCTASSLHVGSLISIMMLLVAAGDRQQADCADGWGDDARWRSIRQG